MTPNQLAELDIYLAAGFDFPTAIAMITPDDGGSPESRPKPQPASPPAKPSASDYIVAGVIVVFILGLSLWWLL